MFPQFTIISTDTFSAQIEIIGINPFVCLPGNILKSIFIPANKDKGKIPVKIKIDGHEFPQTLIKYSGFWRLYINTPMRKSAKKGRTIGNQKDWQLHDNVETQCIASLQRPK